MTDHELRDLVMTSKDFLGWQERPKASLNFEGTGKSPAEYDEGGEEFR